MTLGSLTSWYGSTGTTIGWSGSLLASLYGRGTQAGAGDGQNPVIAMRVAEQNRARSIQRTAAQPEVKRTLDRFTAAVGGATSVAQLLGNPAVMQVLLTANGLGDQVAYTALARKTLMSDVNDATSLANTLTDTRWKKVVQTYDFASKGLSVIQKSGVAATLADAYAEIVWRKSLDAATPGLSNAMSFRTTAGTITSVDEILGDPVMREVVTTALEIPLQIAFQPLEAQEKAISSRVDIARFKDPKFVDRFTQRYLIAAGAKAAASATQAPDLTTLAAQLRGLVV